MILDTFTILFESDAKTLEDGLDDSRKQADRLNKEMVKADSNAAKTTTSIGTALKSMAALAAGFFAVGAARSSFAEVVDNLNVLGRTADSLGDSVENVDAFSRSLIEMGGDAQGARDSMMDMSESIGEAFQDIESGRAKTFAALGISLKDVNGQSITATEGMLRLAESVEGMSKSEAIFRIKELGITDNRTVELLLKGRKEMERMLAVQKEQSGVTKESVENARKYQEALARLNNAQDSVSTQIAAAFIPALTKVIEWVAKGVEWMRENQQTATAFFGVIAAVVAAVYLPAMLSAAAATLAATWPLVAMVAVVGAVAAAFALLYDDVQNFLAGNDSLIGQISEKYPIVGETVRAVADGIKEAWAAVKDFMGEIWEALKPLGEAYGAYFTAIGDTIGIFLGIMNNAAQQIGRVLGVDIGGAFEGLGMVVGKVMDGIVAVIRGAVSFITGALGIAGKAIEGIGAGVMKVAEWLGLSDEEEAPAQQGAARGRASAPQYGPAVPVAPEPRPQYGPAVPVVPAQRQQYGPSVPVVPAPSVSANVAAGNAALATANASPLNSVTSSSISNSVANNKRETNVQVGEVTVNTQATDAEGISRDIGGSLEQQLSRLDSEYSTGVDR